MAHREDIKSFLGSMSFKGKQIIDWGCGTKPAKNYIRHEGCEFFMIDKLAHVKADLVEDMCKNILLKKEYDVAFCMEVIEHVENPKALIRNIFFNLKAGGELYMSVPFMLRVHSPEDYWRFTDLGIRMLLNWQGFEVKEIKPTEGNAGWLVSAYKPL